LLFNVDAGLHVEGTSGPLVVQLGGSVLLPCSAQDPLPLEGLRVEWRRTDSESVVNVLQEKDIRADLQSQTFRGRANFFPEEISKGNFSILLSDITREDAGVYRCGVHFNQDLSETTVEVQLSEQLVVMGALHPIFISVGEEVILNCSVDSQIPIYELEEVTWKKHPDIPILVFQENQTFPEFSQESYRGRAEFFTSEIPQGNFSLKLKDVRMEDKEEFICEVHTADLSAQTTVVIEQIGLSSLQIFILVLCFISLTLSVGLGVAVFIFLQKQETDRWVMIMYHVLAVCPNICMFTAFVLWSTEGALERLLSEVVICAAVSLTRCLMLMKTAPYLYTLPGTYLKPLRIIREVKILAVPLQYLIISVALLAVELVGNIRISVGELERILMLVGMAIPGVISIITDVFVTLSSLGFGITLILSLQRHYFQQKPLKCTYDECEMYDRSQYDDDDGDDDKDDDGFVFSDLHIGLTSAAVTTICIYNILVFMYVGRKAGNFAYVWMLPFVSAVYITVWVVLVFVVRCQKLCCRRRGLGCDNIKHVVYFDYVELSFLLTDISGYSITLALLHILTASALLDHPERIQKLPHTILHLFGSSGLSIVTSITLVTELILKSGLTVILKMKGMQISRIRILSLFGDDDDDDDVNDDDDDDDVNDDDDDDDDSGLHVEGPSGPLVVHLGGSVLLPCSAQDPLPLEGLRVEWRTDSESVVNVLQQKDIRADLQSETFRGRANFFPEEISKGNFSILLSDIRREDAGVYRCGVHSNQDLSETTVEVQLSERLVVTGALYPIFTSVGEEVILNCSVDSHIPVHQLEEVTWKKYPNIPVLLFHENQIISEFSQEGYRGRVEFFTSEIPQGNFSLRLRDVRMEDKGEFICEVHAADLSAQTTVVIRHIGFSSLQIFILVLCFISLTLSVGLGVPVFISLQKQGLLNEVVICAAVSLTRCLMLMKTAPYLHLLPEFMRRGLHIGLASAVVATICLYNITGFIYVGKKAGNFAYVWKLPFVSAVYITVWVVLVFVVRCQRPCCRRRGLGYLLCSVLLFISVAMYGILFIYYITDSIKNRELPHTILHLFGSSGLSIITSITLITELILKSGTGLRTLPELHVIILPFESVFISSWITLQTYNSWLKMRSRIKDDFEDGRATDLQSERDCFLVVVNKCGVGQSDEGLFCGVGLINVGVGNGSAVVSLSGLFCGPGGTVLWIVINVPCQSERDCSCG
ncbi:hypothetical protein NFI96_021578, partial [Prochilodus magdalenae]